MLARSKEHTDDSLAQLDYHLTNYYEYSPIFQQYSKSRFTFPKNHMLQKYANDIHSRGTIVNYSTTHSEHKHILEAKKPAKQTNRCFDSLVQMANFVEKKDLLFDVGVARPSSIWNQQAKKTVSEVTEARNTMEWMLSSLGPRHNTVQDICARGASFRFFYTLLHAFLDTDIEGNITSTNLRTWPLLDTTIIDIYKTLTILDYNENDSSVVQDRIRTYDSFFSHEQKSFALFSYGQDESKYGQVLLLFKCTYGGEQLYLVLAREFVSQNKEHDTGLEVLKQALHHNYDGLFVAHIRQIERSIAIVPDFSSSCAFSAAIGADVYGQYFLNHDADRGLWTDRKGSVSLLTSKVVWETDIPVEGPDESENDSFNTDDEDDEHVLSI
ncbi:hypothetical protein BJV82DRAFT_674985 [Fennellomyces sp. T-0311]|nr:hypothetical protein BJV82DRAFT_674985 [Fennellomyces sp. T-0311]